MMRHWSREKHGSKRRQKYHQAYPLKVVGKVDRVDREDDGSLRVVDYKTGQAACERPYYKEELRNELRERALFQFRVYAWMLSRRDGGADVSALRLLYLGGEKAVAVDEALPADPKDRRKALEDTERELVDIWKRIRAKVDQGALSFESCDRKWCFCHAARPLCFPAADDARPSSDDLAAKSVNDLRELCRARGLDSVVKRGQDVRATLTARLSGGNVAFVDFSRDVRARASRSKEIALFRLYSTYYSDGPTTGGLGPGSFLFPNVRGPPPAFSVRRLSCCSPLRTHPLVRFALWPVGGSAAHRI